MLKKLFKNWKAVVGYFVKDVLSIRMTSEEMLRLAFGILFFAGWNIGTVWLMIFLTDVGLNIFFVILAAITSAIFETSIIVTLIIWDDKDFL